MPLTAFQERVARLVLDASGGEVSLVGGAALIVHGVTDRDTADLDAFSGKSSADTAGIAHRIQAALEAEGLTAQDVSPAEGTLRRLLVSSAAGDGPLKVEISADRQILPSIETSVGAVVDPRELGANKILTVYNNPTRGRDADDIAQLCARHTFDDLLNLASREEVVPLDRTVLGEMFTALADVDDPTFDVSQPVRQFIRDIAAHLRSGSEIPASPYAT